MIQKASKDDISSIISIAKITWNATYKTIISQEQIDYMLHLFYSEKTIMEQMQNPANHFWGFKEEGKLSGYAHCVEDNNDKQLIKLSKLYVLPETQRQGIGKSLMSYLENECKALDKNVITLNVNRHNPAKDFYLKLGYEIVEEVDIPLDKFWLNDYVMEKRVG